VNVLARQSLKSLFTLPMIVSALVLLAVLFIALAGEIVATHDPNELDITQPLAKPSKEHILGTDKTGRDLFSRLILGSRITILSAFCVVIISAIIGIPFGMAAGYFGGFIDTLLMRISDIILSFPSLLLAFVFVAAFGRGISNSVLAIGIVYVPALAKLARSITLVEKNKVYVEAARSIGYQDFRILVKEIFPNCMSTLTVEMTLDIGYAILDLAAMSFLGLGVQPPTADWGAMLADGRIVLIIRPLLCLAPGGMIIITVTALNIFGDCIRTWMEPSQRRLPSIRSLRRKGAAT
jgi:peptide/nickel transport system permease protein